MKKKKEESKKKTEYPRCARTNESKYPTYEIAMADTVVGDPELNSERVGYKCNYCKKWHVG